MSASVSASKRFSVQRMRGLLTAALARADLFATFTACGTCWSGRRPPARAPRALRGVAMGAQPQARWRGRWRKSIAYALVERRNAAGAGAAARDLRPGEAEAIRDSRLGVPIAVVPNGVDPRDAALQAPSGHRARLGNPRLALSSCCFSGHVPRIKRLDLTSAPRSPTCGPPSARSISCSPDPDELRLVPGLRQRLRRARADAVHASRRQPAEAAPTSGRC